MATKSSPAELQGHEDGRKHFAIIYVLGAPGAGKGTLCSYLAQEYNLVHCSVGDLIRNWANKNPDKPLAKEIASKLENQGFLDSSKLLPFIKGAIKQTMECKNTDNNGRGPHKGILIDGFPRTEEQMWMLSCPWPFEKEMPLHGGKPDLVLSLDVDKDIAKERYISRRRDSNDSEEKFERRFEEFEINGEKVAKMYRDRGILIDLDANQGKVFLREETKRMLNASELWRRAVIDQGLATSWFKRSTWMEGD